MAKLSFFFENKKNFPFFVHNTLSMFSHNTKHELLYF